MADSNARRPSRSSSRRRQHSQRRHSSTRRPPTRAGNAALARANNHHEPRHHPQIETDLPNAQPKAYKPQHLSLALQNNATSTPTKFATHLSHTQLLTLHSDLPLILSSQPITEIKSFLESWVGILDTVFFFNNLIRRGLKGGFSLYHKANSKSQGHYSKETQNIRINTWDGGGGGGGGGAEQMVCTLFHTMVSAFFDLYSCECEECGSGEYGVGTTTGHGSAWVDVMVLFDRELQKEVGWVVDCNVVESIRLEMRQCPGWRPGNEQLVAWGAEELVQREVQQLPVDDEEEEEEEEEEDHYQRTGIRRREQTRCCIVM